MLQTTQADEQNILNPFPESLVVTMRMLRVLLNCITKLRTLMLLSTHLLVRRMLLFPEEGTYEFGYTDIVLN
jgi:hypothetical protein